MISWLCSIVVYDILHISHIYVGYHRLDSILRRQPPCTGVAIMIKRRHNIIRMFINVHICNTLHVYIYIYIYVLYYYVIT